MKFESAVIGLSLLLALVLAPAGEAHAAGTLKDEASGTYATIVDHHVSVVLDNGFARTEVTQVFENPSTSPIDAIYEFPVPQDAALSQMKIVLADRTLNGEVLPTEQAQSIYDEQKKNGNQAGLATKDGHQNFRFSIANIPGSSQATMSFVYYEPLAIDDGVGRYLYPLEDGGTSPTPWSGNQSVNGTFRFDLELKSSVPIQEVTMPGLTPDVTKLAEGHFQVSLEASPGSLGKDLVLDYRFPKEAPRRLETVAYRPATGGRGTVMMILTPGFDLAPISHGTDYVFVLDVSGSMESKLQTLIAAVVGSLQKLGPLDHFRVISFSDQVTDIGGGWHAATPEGIAQAISSVQNLAIEGGTDLYQGLYEGISGLDPDRVVSAILVTDAETNTGIIDPAQFDQTVRQSDVRIYGMLMGNNANWPLMEIVTEATGGFYAQVSNQDDIESQVDLAFGKATHEALYDVKLAVTGTGLDETTDFKPTKIYKGQQLILFGRYSEPGSAALTLEGHSSGKPWTIAANVELPAVDTDNAEIERLWALDMIHAIEKRNLLGMIPDAEAKSRIIELGVQYQLVTDYTSMIVVDDATFEKYGVERLNEDSRLGGERELRLEQRAEHLRRCHRPAHRLPGRNARTRSSGAWASRAAEARVKLRVLGRGPWLALALTLVAAWAGSRADLEFDRAGISAGEWWRILTGHFVHYGPAHSLGDILAFAVWAGLVEWISRRLLGIAVAVACLVVGLGIYIGCPEVVRYGGLSGIDVALVVVLLGALWSSPKLRAIPLSRVWVMGIAGLLVVKSAYELVTHSAILAPDLGSGVVLLPAAHALGVAAGLVSWLFEASLGGEGRTNGDPPGEGDHETVARSS